MHGTPNKPSAEERAEKLIRDAEVAKGKIFTTTGNNQFHVDSAREMIHSVLVDEDYCTVRSHLDDVIIGKVKRGEYVNFAKLLPQDKLAIEEDINKLQRYFKDGQV